MRAIGYFRETKHQSLAEQGEIFLEFCRRNGYEAAATFLDSASDGDLPGFRQMLEFVKQQNSKGFLLVMVSNLLTFGEALTHATRRYFQLASLGVPIYSIEAKEDISVGLLEIWSKHHADGNVGDRVKAAMRQRAVRGEALGRPPFGYRVGPRRRLVIVAEEGSIVRYIFRLYLKDDLGIRRIARRLNDENLRTRRGGLWSMVTVRDILRNRSYVGTYSRFGVRVPDSHAALIRQEDFSRVQERLDQRRPASASRQLSPFLLSRLAYCGYCGNKMIGVTRKQKWQRGDGTVRVAQYRYYQCETRTNRSLCDWHTHKAEELEDSVRDYLVSRKNGAASGPSGNGASSLAEIENQIRRLRGKTRRLDKQLEHYLDSAASGQLNAEKLSALCTIVAQEQLQIDEKLAESHRLVQHEASESEIRKRRQHLMQRLRDDWLILSLAEKHDLMTELFERVIVKDDGVEAVLRQS